MSAQQNIAHTREVMKLKITTDEGFWTVPNRIKCSGQIVLIIEIMIGKSADVDINHKRQYFQSSPLKYIVLGKFGGIIPSPSFHMHSKNVSLRSFKNKNEQKLMKLPVLF